MKVKVVKYTVSMQEAARAATIVQKILHLEHDHRLLIQKQTVALISSQ